MKGVTFIIIKSVAMEGDGCWQCKSAIKSLKRVEDKMKKYNECQFKVPRLILRSHFPLYRHSDEQDEDPIQFREG